MSFLGAALNVIGCGAAQRPDGGSGMLQAGAHAPDVQGRDVTGQSVRLEEPSRKPAIVYFYPKDDTPGCTKEACAFRDAFDQFKQAGVTVFGVSRDTASSHEAFRKKHSLPFVLVSDESGDVQKAYGVSSFFSMPSRVSFLVGRDGKIAKVWPKVDPVMHASEVLAEAKALP